MTDANQQSGDAEQVLKDATMTAWEAAAAEGIDMSLIEESLRKTPEERLREHGYALATFELLLNARSQRKNRV